MTVARPPRLTALSALVVWFARVLIGDVRGKGLNAVGELALLVGAFREVAATHDTLPALAAALDGSVGRYLTDYAEDFAHPSGHFTTAVLLDIPDD